MKQRDDDVDGQLHTTTIWSSNKVNLLHCKWYRSRAFIFHKIDTSIPKYSWCGGKRSTGPSTKQPGCNGYGEKGVDIMLLTLEIYFPILLQHFNSTPNLVLSTSFDFRFIGEQSRATQSKTNYIGFQWIYSRKLYSAKLVKLFISC